jgi:hypothetical protein
MTATPFLYVAILCLVLLLAGSIWFYGEEGRIARSIVFRFFLTIALPVAVLLGIPLVAVALVFDLDARLWQAAIAGLVIATGWLTTAIFMEQGKVRVKAERLRDYHKAIYAEIGTSIDALWDEGQSDSYIASILERMKKDSKFVPFIPREEHDHIYNAIVGEIDVLPRQTIDVVVAYYSQIKAIAALAEDMRGDQFQKLSQDRRILMYQDYSGMRRQAFAYGQHALRLITAYSIGGEAAVKTAETSVSIRDEGQNGLSQGSV